MTTVDKNSIAAFENAIYTLLITVDSLWKAIE